jgi:hypothetical protein
MDGPLTLCELGRTVSFPSGLALRRNLQIKILGLKDLIMVLYLCRTGNVDTLRLTLTMNQKEARRDQVLLLTARPRLDSY